VREAIEAAGAELRFLPPYSPDFNPIENAFAKLKELLRNVVARTRDALWNAVAGAIRAFTPVECANYFVEHHLLRLAGKTALRLTQTQIRPWRAAGAGGR
jgi:transposase